MGDSLSLEEIFNGVSDDLFDEAIKYLDFPMESLETNNMSAGGEPWDCLQGLEAAHENSLTSFSSELHGVLRSENLDKGLPVIKQQECAAGAYFEPQRSVFIKGNIDDKSQLIFFQTSSPTSVLESSSSCSGENQRHLNVKLNFPVTKRARSNKRRPASTLSLHPVLRFPFSPSFAAGDSQFMGTCPSERDSRYTDEPAKKRQKKKMKFTSVSGADETSQASLEQEGAIRKCTHCQITKTPQWREGPLGPKTLCNACGVRYRSGRLLPEYRPAASPTFIPSVHSNSHKKVIELRKQAAADTGAIFARTMLSPLAKNVT